MHPVAQGLPVHAGRPCRGLARAALQHQRQGEHPPRRPRVPAPARLAPQLARAQLLPRDRHRHGPPPPIGYTADQRPRAARGATGPTVRSRGRWYKLLASDWKATSRPSPEIEALSESPFACAPIELTLTSSVVALAASAAGAAASRPAAVN